MGVTADQVANMPDHEVEYEVFKVLLPMVARGGDAEYETFSALSRGLRMLWATLVLDGEVNNGGFNQFFFNSSGQYAMDAVEGFRLIGAEQHAQLTEEAIALFFKEAPKLRRFWRPRTLEGFSESYQHTQSGELDKRYYALPHPSAARVRYIREHPAEFEIAD